MPLMKKTLLFSIIFFSSCQTISIPLLSSDRKERPTRTSKRPYKTSIDHKQKSYKALKREEIALEAKKYIGIPYNYGGKKPSSGFDCSGFSTFVFAKEGIAISGSSTHLASLGKQKLFNSIEKGDLAFFGSNHKVSHVAIVLEKTKHSFEVIHATSSRGVMITDVMQSEYWTKKYLFTRDVLTNTNYGFTGLDD